MKQDLSEFVTTIQHDTTVTVAETAANVKEKLKVLQSQRCYVFHDIVIVFI